MKFANAAKYQQEIRGSGVERSAVFLSAVPYKTLKIPSLT
jgi:hypothetical protein